MGFCFLCDSKLYGERTRVCSSITPHSNVPFAEKIVELMGEEFVVIVTPADHMCKRCTSLLTHMDKLENDAKLVRNALCSYVQKKYGLLPPDQQVKTLDVVNGNLKAEEIDNGQRTVALGMAVKENVVNTPLKIAKTPQQETCNSKMKIYKCGFCSFQSKELGHVRFHMRSHVHKKDGEKAAVKSLVPPAASPQQKKRLYRCQVCSASFDSRLNCLEHIQKDHNSQHSANTEAKESGDIPSETAKVTKSDPLKTDIKTESTLDQDTIQMEMSKTVKVGKGNTKEETQNNEKKVSIKQENTSDDIPSAKQEIDTQKDSLNEQGHEEENVNAVASGNTNKKGNEVEDPSKEEAMDIDKVIQKKVRENSVKGAVNKAEDLDIESMLAAIHNDNSSAEGVTGGDDDGEGNDE